MGMTNIRTKRLVLKKPELDDKAHLVARIGDFEVSKWLATVPYPYTMDDADFWYGLIADQELNFNIYHDDGLIGGVGLTKEADTGIYDLGYWIARDYWGRGFATEAARGILVYASKIIPDAKISSSYMIENNASANILKKLGFIEVGNGEINCLARGEKVQTIILELP